MRRILSIGLVAALLVVTTASVMGYINGGWPETCLEMNDMVEASPQGSGAIGIYQQAFGSDAEKACRSDHREDVRRSFGWAFDIIDSEVYESCEAAESANAKFIQGDVGSGIGFPQSVVPSARDGDGDDVVCEKAGGSG